MKKSLLFIILTLAVGVLLGLSVFALDGGIKYEIEDDAVTVTGYNGISNTVVIPSEIDGRPVTKIAPYAFERSGLVTVRLPDSVEEIGEKAFFRCFDLTGFVFPGSLKTIGQNAFAYTGLTEVDLSGCTELETVKTYAFAYCEELKTVTLPAHTASYYNGLLMECPKLETVNNMSSMNGKISQSYFSGDRMFVKGKVTRVTIQHNDSVLSHAVSGETLSAHALLSFGSDVEEIFIEDPTDVLIDGRNMRVFPNLKTITLGERITEPEEYAMTAEEYMNYYEEHGKFPASHQYEAYCIDEERGIIYNKTKYDYYGMYIIVYVIPEWEGAEILYLPEGFKTQVGNEGFFNQCKRKAVVFPDGMKPAKSYFSASDTGDTVFFFSEDVEIEGVKTASLSEFTPETYPYIDFSNEEPLDRYDDPERIEDNSKYPKTAQAADMPFSDVSPEAWYFEATNYAYHNGITSGTGEGLFAPDVPLTRAMFVQMLAKIEKADIESYADKNNFEDVLSDAWYHNAVEWAFENGIVSGTASGIFSPDDKITREQIAVIMYAMSEDRDGADISKYTDADRVSSWALGAVKWAVKAGYISGTGETTLSPRSNATRAQALQILYRYIDNTKIDYARTGIKVSNAFSDDMIIQRGEKITVWGWVVDPEDEGRADIGKYVKVDLGGKAAGYAVIDENGQWKVDLDRILPASDEKLKLTVSTKNQKIEYDGIMMGDVYMVIGQSNVYYSFNHYISVNMQYLPSYFTENFAPYLHKTRYMDGVRLFRSSSEDYKYYEMNDYTEYDEVLHERGWQKPDDPALDYKGVNGQTSTYYDYRSSGAEPMACEIFSAFGYCMACEIYERTGVPTGMIQIDGSGYPIASFMPGELCEKMGIDSKDGKQYTDTETGSKSRFVYNQCIRPLENLSIAGLIWYQGESDGFNNTWCLEDPSTSFAYRWSALMDYMRGHMNNDDFPVYLTELPMCCSVFMQMYLDLGGIRADEYLAVEMTDNAYLVSTSDLWTNKSYIEQIHLPAKPAMAKRYAEVIANTVYGRGESLSEVCGPIMTNVEYGDGEIIVTFDNVGDGLKFYGGHYNGGFTLNSEITWVPQGMFPAKGRTRTEIKDPAKVQIIGKDKVRIECDYSDFAGIAYNACSSNCFPYNCNLCNSYNIPACAFSSYK